MTDTTPRFDATVAEKGEVRLATAPEVASAPIVIGDNDPRVNEVQFVGEVEVSLASSPGTGEDCILVPGVLNDDLYLFCNADPAGGASSLRGSIRRLRKGEEEWETIASGTGTFQAGTHQFSGSFDWGAVEFKGKLYVGDTSGELWRLDLEDNGDFDAITQVFTGGNLLGHNNHPEDCHPGPVLWGKLFIGTYGANLSGGPGLWAWDGVSAAATEVIWESYVGEGGLCEWMTVYNGRLYCAFASSGATPRARIWAVNPDLTTEMVYTASAGPKYALRTLGDSLVGVRADTGMLQVWQDGAFVDVAAVGAGMGFAPYGLAAVGDAVVVLDYYAGPFLHRNGHYTQIDLPAGYGGAASTGHSKPVVWDGALWWTATSDKPALFKLPLGAERQFRSLADTQQSIGGGAAPLRRLVSDSDTKGVVLKSANGKFWRWTVDNSGVLSTADLGTTRPTS